MTDETALPVKVLVGPVPVCPRCGKSGMVAAVLDASGFTGAACFDCFVVWRPGAEETEVADARAALERMIDGSVLKGEPLPDVPRDLRSAGS